MTSRKEARHAEARAARRRSSLRVLALCAAFVVIGAAGSLLTFGVGIVEESASRRLAGVQARVVIGWPAASGADGKPTGGTWLSADVRGVLEQLAGAQVAEDADPLSSAGLARVGAALHETGWFQSMPTVRREDGGVIRVRAVWRVPVAVVRVGNLDHLVARGGELLPQAFPAGRSGYRVIQGARSGPPAAYGTPWDGGDVQAAIQWVELASGRAWWDQVAAIDVSEFLTRRSVRIVTRWGGVIVWGGAPGDPAPGEQTTAVKLARLDTLAQRYGRIDAKHSRVEVFGPLTVMVESDGAALDSRPAGGSARVGNSP